MLIHVVKPGEALWQIASFYRVPVMRITNVNELPNPNRLLVGQSLVIPTEDLPKVHSDYLINLQCWPLNLMH